MVGVEDAGGEDARLLARELGEGGLRELQL